MRGCGAHDPAQPAVCALCATIVASRGQRLRKLMVTVPLVLGFGGVAGWLLTRPPIPPTPPHADAGDPVEALQRARLAKTPCDHETSTALEQNLMDQARWREARDFAAASIAKCGVIDQMKLHLAYCDGKLRDYTDGERVTSELNTETSGDSDFWWWRGEALAYDGKSDAALADDRQSLALSAWWQPGQFAANRIALPATDAHEPCEADRAWRYYVRALSGTPSQDMRDATAAHSRDKSCAAQAGSGHAALGARVAVTLVATDASPDAVFAVDPQLGTTVISRSFAARAGIEATGDERVQAESDGKLLTGTPMQLTLRAGGASAAGVDVLVTDDLPGDAGGILGLSFLWHFDMAPRAGGVIALAPEDPRSL